MRGILIAVGLILLLPSAAAGTREAPEVPDAAGDCAFAPGNEYADIVAAWISDETAMDFLVNVALAKWTQDALASYAGYTIQFTHQGVQWGVAALFDPQAGWEWSTGFIDTSTGEMGNFSDTTGAWDAGSATMTILFPKSLFPHTGNDNALQGFAGGSADFKKDVPIFLAQGVGAPVPGQDIMMCDLVESAAVYTFTVGQHTMASPDPSGPLDAPTGAPTAEAPTGPTGPTPASPAPAGTPGIGVVATLALLACLAASRRGR